MKGFTLVLALVFGIQAIRGAEILQGYMLAKDGTTCIKTDATDKSGVVDSSGATGRTATELAKAKCTLLSVQDGDEAGSYIVEKQGDTNKKMKLIDKQAITFDKTGTQLIFTPEGTTEALKGITADDVGHLTTKSTPVYVAIKADSAGHTNCLKKNGNYHKGNDNTKCTGHLWYFVTESSAVIEKASLILMIGMASLLLIIF